MNGSSFVADTNFLIDIHEWNPKTEPFLDGTVVASVISEIELLGWRNISETDKKALEELLHDCILIELTSEIRALAIEMKQRQNIKTPDAIIAATSLYLNLPLVTSDKGFKNIKDIELILLEHS